MASQKQIEEKIDQAVHEWLGRKALNFAYEKPYSLYELVIRGVDRYKTNYDKVFGK